MTTDSGILIRKIPWTEEPGGPRSLGPQSVMQPSEWASTAGERDKCTAEQEARWPRGRQGVVFQAGEEWCRGPWWPGENLENKQTNVYLAAPHLSRGVWDLVPWPGTLAPALGAWSLSPWTTREVPGLNIEEKQLRGQNNKACEFEIGNLCGWNITYVDILYKKYKSFYKRHYCIHLRTDTLIEHLLWATTAWDEIVETIHIFM